MVPLAVPFLTAVKKLILMLLSIVVVLISWVILLLRGEVAAVRFQYVLSVALGLDTTPLDELIDEQSDAWAQDIRARSYNKRTSMRRRERDLRDLEFLEEWSDRQVEQSIRSLRRKQGR